jgi:hypothetical protein
VNRTEEKKRNERTAIHTTMKDDRAKQALNTVNEETRSLDPTSNPVVHDSPEIDDHSEKSWRAINEIGATKVTSLNFSRSVSNNGSFHCAGKPTKALFIRSPAGSGCRPGPWNFWVGALFGDGWVAPLSKSAVGSLRGWSTALLGLATCK